ncbi:MAG: hypothetical protein MMC23_005585 [Stictis urceolatum]|nr:hypothetical protein [Stictis urceolata]
MLKRLLSLAIGANFVSSNVLPQTNVRHLPGHRLTKRACDNSASHRSCWGDYDTSTDYYNEVPDTGVERVYYLELTETTASPDGYERMAMLFNGTLPGPTIEADWGDQVTIHVRPMDLQSTGMASGRISLISTTVLHPLLNAQSPLAIHIPIRGVQSSTAHLGTTPTFALQAWEGVFGPIVIQGPTTGNYDTDIGPLFLNDWSHQTADELYFSIDNHTMIVIAMDFVPIEPFETEYISIGMGQRYDVIVTADQSSGDYWMRAVPQTTCSKNDNSDNIRGIVRFDSSSTSNPSSAGTDFCDDCDDMPMASLVLYVSKDAGSDDSESTLAVSVSSNSAGLFKWYIGGTTTAVEWADPSLLQIYNNATTYTWSNSSGVIELAEANVWAFFVIQTTNTVSHPIHLHGHDFYILSQDTGTFNSSVSLTTSNPPRRDVAMLPGGGYLVVGFQTDNPGAWLMHCHIGWHTSEGFALQFIERQSEIEID